MIHLSDFFSARYAKKSAIDDNFVQELMYRITFPLALLLNRIGVAPNSITSASIVFSVLAAAALFLCDSWWGFVALWLLSLSLDLCDGVVARISMRVSKVAFRYDHYSDLFKFLIVGAAVIVKYEDTLTSLLVLTGMFWFMMYSLLHQDVTTRTRSAVEARRERVEVGKSKRILRNLVVVASTINGHTYLLIALVAMGSVAACVVYGYIGFVSIVRSILLGRQLLSMPR